MKTFKFLTRPRDYNITVNFVPMFKVSTHDNITQSDIDKWNDIADEYILSPNTEANRNEMMNKLGPYFLTIESIYSEDEVV